MTNHEKFLDAMNGVDEKFLSVHIRQKCPTAGDKVKRYALAVAAYAAAIIAVAVILPFIIGKGDDPTPRPGDDPVVTETQTPMPDDPELQQIDVADIDAKYNGTDPEKQSDKVALDEVKAIISAARRAYAEYDVIVLADGTLMPTKAKLQDYTLEQIEELSEDERDTLYEEYDEYFNNMFTVIEEMLDLRFPENSIYEKDDPDNNGYPTFYTMNMPDTGFTTAEELVNSENDVYAEWIITDLMNAKTVQYLDSEANYEDETELLYPTPEEFEIWRDIEVWRIMKELPLITETTPETTPEVTAPPTETTTTTAPPPETTTTTPPPETEPPETIPAVTVTPPIENLDPFVFVDPRPLITSDTAPVDTETTTDWYFVLNLYRKQFDNCKTNTNNRCAYLIGWDKDYHLDYAGETVDDESMYYTEDDVIEFTVLFINMNSETVVFRDDEYSRDPLSNVVYDFVYKSYSNTDKTPGKTEVHLDPGEMWVYTASIDLAKIEDRIIQWNQAWNITSYIEYYIGDVKYTDSLTAYIGPNYRR